MKTLKFVKLFPEIFCGDFDIAIIGLRENKLGAGYGHRGAYFLKLR